MPAGLANQPDGTCVFVACISTFEDLCEFEKFEVRPFPTVNMLTLCMFLTWTSLELWDRVRIKVRLKINERIKVRFYRMNVVKGSIEV